MQMENLIDVTIPVDAETARALVNPERRAEAGRYISDLLRRRRVVESLAEAIAGAKQEARGNGVTDEMVDADLTAWRVERNG